MRSRVQTGFELRPGRISDATLQWNGVAAALEVPLCELLVLGRWNRRRNAKGEKHEACAASNSAAEEIPCTVRKCIRIFHH